MSKRFSETSIWEEDWFLEMPNEYKLFWQYMLSKCDHAGIFKVNLRTFRGLLEVKVTTEEALGFFNSGKQRIRIITESIWYIEDFFVFQYGTTLNINNRMHDSIVSIWKKYDIALTSIRGLKDLKDRVKVKVKDICISIPEEKPEISNPAVPKEIPIVGTEAAIQVARGVWADQSWREQTCMAHTFLEDDLKRWMAQFNTSIANDTMPDFTESKYKKLFGGWLNKQKSKGYTLTDKPKSNSTGLRTLKPEA
jgi:hypothetical protein